MCEDIISGPRSLVIDFVKKCTKCEVLSDGQKVLLDAVLQIVPFIGRHEEENKKLTFKISVGLSNSLEGLEGRFHVLHKYHYDEKAGFEMQIPQILNIIKKAAIFCEKDADVFLVEHDGVIACGVYFTDLEKTGTSEATLRNKNFVIFQNVYKNKFVMLGYNSEKYIYLDLDDHHLEDNALTKPIFKHDATVCRTWQGIFEKIKKTVHGTICLIVDDSWKADEDKNFTDSIEELTNINLSREGYDTFDQFQDFENKLSLFLSMLDYDGITIIDTAENVRAYNSFCKIGTSNLNKETGGARHRAYSNIIQLSQENRMHYMAVYFQSQEGEIKFHNFSNEDSGNGDSDFFDPTVMNNNSENSQMNMVSKIIKCRSNDAAILVEEDTAFYRNLDKRIDELKNAHYDFDNFYNEPLPAQNLLEALSSNEQNNNILQKYDDILFKLINIVMECIIGNSYGYSRVAQKSLKTITDVINIENWERYFNKCGYVDGNLLWSLSDFSLNERWKDNIPDKVKNIPEIANHLLKYEPHDYRDMYLALTDSTCHNL